MNNRKSIQFETGSAVGDMTEFLKLSLRHFCGVYRDLPDAAYCNPTVAPALWVAIRDLGLANSIHVVGSFDLPAHAIRLEREQ